MRRYIIPARAGSKGFPHKNRKLFAYTAASIPFEDREKVIVSTDDEFIVKEASRYNFEVIWRPPDLATDTSCIKDVLIHIRDVLNLESDCDMIMLYLTYPQRTWECFSKIYDFYKQNRLHSLLCKKESSTHPFLCCYKRGDYGTQIVSHNLYRRQDYPECFEISHYVAISKCHFLEKLNKNLYHEETFFYKIDDVVDVDSVGDFNTFKNNEIF